jgi:hypothetical protein
MVQIFLHPKAVKDVMYEEEEEEQRKVAPATLYKTQTSEDVD